MSGEQHAPDTTKRKTDDLQAESSESNDDSPTLKSFRNAFKIFSDNRKLMVPTKRTVLVQWKDFREGFLTWVSTEILHCAMADKKKLYFSGDMFDHWTYFGPVELKDQDWYGMNLDKSLILEKDIEQDILSLSFAAKVADEELSPNSRSGHEAKSREEKEREEQIRADKEEERRRIEREKERERKLKEKEEQKERKKREKHEQKKKEKINFLQTETKLVQIDKEIKKSIQKNSTDVDKCLAMLEDLDALPVNQVILKRNPDILKTIKMIRKFKGSDKIRKKAEVIYHKFKNFFLQVDGSDGGQTPQKEHVIKKHHVENKHHHVDHEKEQENKENEIVPSTGVNMNREEPRVTENNADIVDSLERNINVFMGTAQDNTMETGENVAMETLQNVAIETSKYVVMDVSPIDTGADESEKLVNRTEEKVVEVTTEHRRLTDLPLPYFLNNDNDGDQIVESIKNESDAQSTDITESSKKFNVDEMVKIPYPYAVESVNSVQNEASTVDDSMDIDNDDNNYSLVANKIESIQTLSNSINADSASSPLTTDFSHSMTQVAQEAAKYNTRDEFPDESDDVLEGREESVGTDSLMCSVKPHHTYTGKLGNLSYLYWEAREQRFHNLRGKLFAESLLRSIFTGIENITLSYSTGGYDTYLDKWGYITDVPTERLSGQNELSLTQDVDNPKCTSREIMLSVLKNSNNIEIDPNESSVRTTPGVFVLKGSEVVLLAEVANVNDTEQRKLDELNLQMLLSLNKHARLFGMLIQCHQVHLAELRFDQKYGYRRLLSRKAFKYRKKHLSLLYCYLRKQFLAKE